METLNLKIYANGRGNITLSQEEGDCLVEITTDMVDMVIRGLLSVKLELEIEV
jgi:hypothetical protein